MRNCEKLAVLGNVTPAISIEGWRTETDEKRGKGTYERILGSIRNLKKEGVPFGFSFTITSKNVDIFLNKDFYDHMFEELGATYLWVFHLMQVGRASENLPLLISPETRVALYRLMEKLLIEKKYCIADASI